MTKPLDRRLRQLEGAKTGVKRLSFRNVYPDDLSRMKEIFLAARQSGDWSHYYEDLARDAPSAYDSYRKAGWCE